VSYRALKAAATPKGGSRFLSILFSPTSQSYGAFVVASVESMSPTALWAAVEGCALSVVNAILV
jgi:hypothetical protein